MTEKAKSRSGPKKKAVAPEGPVVPPEPEPERGFPVVGIGASAGGLAAFGAFFSGMPADVDPGMAFVLVQHLAPDHKSILTELVRRYTRMQVFQVEDGMRVRPNCAYIIPPNRDMAFLDGALHLLTPSAPRGRRLPIDFFFRSLAQDQHERAVCIVLSGTGSDGTLGVRDVKGEGGMAMAQNPESTEFDGMPRSAIATGLVDFVLPPAEMPAQLMAYAAYAFGRKPRAAAAPVPRTENALKKIFILLRAETGHDFSRYKPSTIGRRVERRMAIHQVEDMDWYVRYLQRTPVEVDALFRDILIGVTNFFRDPEAFAALEKQIIPGLFTGKAAGAPLRVWVPGCSHGEEAYSIAILLQEHMEALKRSFKLQIFATDIDRAAIDTGRAGVYPGSIASDISRERLARFFARETDGNAYRIHKGIRDTLVFSEQDVIKDPPFSKLDLISCRNLLIYMGAELHKKLIPLFHYALNPGGFLFLGTSETVGEFTDLFAARDRKAKLYQRKEDVHGASRAGMGRFVQSGTGLRIVPWAKGRAAEENRPPLRELAERALLQKYAPAGALVNGRGDILYVHGRTGLYLEPAPGEFGKNILKMAREGLRRELAAALRKAVASNETVRRPGLRIRTNGDFTVADLTVQPVATGPDAAAAPALFLVVFEKAAASGAKRPMKDAVSGAGQGPSDGPAGAAARVAALRQELRAKEESLQAARAELEISNEERQSSDEELQSANEELETSAEELQSINEELATVNTELQANVADLSRANNDMNNLLAGTGIGTIFVDLQLRILRFTSPITQIINLVQADVGRPVGHIVSNLEGYDHLEADVRVVLDSLVPQEAEVRTRAGAWYLMHIQPYRTLNNEIEGAVITFVDITEMKKTLEALRESEGMRRLAVVVRDARDAITVQDLEGRILAWNPAAERMYGWTEAEALAMNVLDRVPESEREKEKIIVHQLRRDELLTPYPAQRLAKDGRIVWVWLTATALMDEEGNLYAVATTERTKESNTSDRTPGATREDQDHDKEKA
jgi:two-component system, chemotaxis family, CheB/CheR fusion protein